MRLNTEIRLNDYAVIPLYNIKAVVQATGISSSTLRAWERRYNVCSPERSDSGYRLYSDRDIAMLRWLKVQVETGMAISQAVTWLENLNQTGTNSPTTVLPRFYGVQEGKPITAARLDPPRNWEVLGQELLHSLLNYNETQAEYIMAEAFALYPIEQVGERLIAPVLVEIGERWHREQVSVTVGHFATNYVLQRLAALLRIVPNIIAGPLIWIGCAPQELHEVGALLVTIYLRRAGFHVQYLGQTLPENDFVQDVRKHKPAMVLLSASTTTSAETIHSLITKLTRIDTPRPIVCYGGRVFNQQPELRDGISGVFLGESAQDAVEIVAELLYDSIYNPLKNRSLNKQIA